MLFQDKSTDTLVVETVQQWMAAWSSKDMDKYARFYTSDFVCDGMGKTAWVKRKRQLAGKYDYILVTGKNFKAFPTKTGIRSVLSSTISPVDFQPTEKNSLNLSNRMENGRYFERTGKGNSPDKTCAI